MNTKKEMIGVLLKGTDQWFICNVIFPVWNNRIEYPATFDIGECHLEFMKISKSNRVFYREV